MVRLCLRNAFQRMYVRQPQAKLGQRILRRAVPVRLEADVNDLRGEDRGRPLDRMNLGDKVRDDEACRVENPVVAPIGILGRVAHHRWRCARVRTTCAGRSDPTTTLD